MPVPIPTQNGPQTRVPTPREVLGHIRSQVFELSRTTNVVEAMQEILDDFDEIQPPGAIVLTAPSGAGKTQRANSFCTVTPSTGRQLTANKSWCVRSFLSLFHDRQNRETPLPV